MLADGLMCAWTDIVILKKRDHIKVTDGGLAHLKGLTQLQTLSLVRTEVTDAGEKKLQEALPNCSIWHLPGRIP